MRTKGDDELVRLLLSVILALGVSTGLSQRIEASEQWCSGDPIEIIITPGGSITPVFVTTSALGVEHLVAVQVARISYTMAGNGTTVKMTIVVPNDIFGSNFPTASVVSLGPAGTGAILAQTTGVSGRPMSMSFTLPAH
jgi:hypothetical protein